MYKKNSIAIPSCDSREMGMSDNEREWAGVGGNEREWAGMNGNGLE